MFNTILVYKPTSIYGFRCHEHVAYKRAKNDLWGEVSNPINEGTWVEFSHATIEDVVRGHDSVTLADSQDVWCDHASCNKLFTVHGESVVVERNGESDTAFAERILSLMF